jgi:hypothetical protein
MSVVIGARFKDAAKSASTHGLDVKGSLGKTRSKTPMLNLPPALVDHIDSLVSQAETARFYFVVNTNNGAVIRHGRNGYIYDIPAEVLVLALDDDDEEFRDGLREELPGVNVDRVTSVNHFLIVLDNVAENRVSRALYYINLTRAEIDVLEADGWQHLPEVDVYENRRVEVKDAENEN